MNNSNKELLLVKCGNITNTTWRSHNNYFILSMLSLPHEIINLILLKMFNDDPIAVKCFCQTPIIFAMIFMCERLVSINENKMPINISYLLPNFRYDIMNTVTNKDYYTEAQYTYLTLLPQEFTNVLLVKTNRVQLSSFSCIKNICLAVIQLVGFNVIILYIYFFDPTTNGISKIILCGILILLCLALVWSYYLRMKNCTVKEYKYSQKMGW